MNKLRKRLTTFPKKVLAIFILLFLFTAIESVASIQIVTEKNPDDCNRPIVTAMFSVWEPADNRVDHIPNGCGCNQTVYGSVSIFVDDVLQATGPIDQCCYAPIAWPLELEMEYNLDGLTDGFHEFKAQIRDVNGGIIETKTEVVDVSADCGLDITSDPERLVPGEVGSVKAETCPENVNIEWTITTIKGDATGVPSPDASTKVLTITGVTGKGTLLVQAVNPDTGCIDVTDIEVGCEKCEGEGKTCDIFGLNSIDVSLGLGKAAGGKSAGKIALYTHDPSPLNATPQALEIYNYGIDPMIIRDGSAVRQLIVPENFVDVVVIDEYGYNIHFYDPAAKGDFTGTLFEVLPGFLPRFTWTVENPDRESSHNRLRFTKDKEGSILVHEYTWDDAASTWSLSKGNATQIITKKEEQLSPGLRMETDTIKSASGAVASKVQTTYKTISCGGEEREVKTHEVIDPEGDALSTTSTWYEEPCPEGACGKLAERVHPDGSWEAYTYEAPGRIITEKRSWLDEAEGSGSARIISYDYTPLDPLDTGAMENTARPRTRTEAIAGIVVAKTFYAYAVDGTSLARTEIEERCKTTGAAYGAAGNQRTTTVKYPFDPALATSFRIKSVTHPDGRKGLYAYAFGTFTPNADPTIPGAFTPVTDIRGVDYAIRTIVSHVTAGNPSGIPDRTLRTVTVENKLGRELQRETELFRESGYERIAWRVNLYDEEGNLSDTYAHDGTHSEEIWDCCGKTSETSVQGIVQSYLYDDLGRTLLEARQTAEGDLTTTYTRDGEGRILTQTVSNGGLSQTTTRTYDVAGRLTSQTDAAGLTTLYVRSADGLITTITRPGGATEITERYPDGNIRSVTGTAVIHRFYTYGINPDGTRWTQINTGTVNSPLWEKTTADALGRTISIEKPGPEGTETTLHTYNDMGLLESVTPPGQAPTLYTYDALGNLYRKGLDIDESGSLNPASLDRIDEADTAYVSLDGALWRQSAQRVYAKSSDATPTTTAVLRERLTGLGTGGLTSETVNVDVRGNETVARTVIDRANATVTRTVDHPDTTIDSRTVSRYGLPVSTRSKTGVEQTFTHDALQRRTGVTDPRTGTTTLHYDDKGRLAHTDDPAGRQTFNTYDPATGRKIAETNPAGKVTRYAYDARGLLTHTWGDGTLPVQYRYDAVGRKTEMHTYQAGEGWNGESWPEGATGTAAITRWHYDPATGLLTGKTYDDGKGVTYTYTSGGRLKTRTWARTVDGQPLVTTYSYDPATAELTGIDYSDATPAIAFTHDRPGRKKSVTDAVGTRVFTYNESLQLSSETFTLLTGDAPPDVPAAENDYHVSYGYELDTGRFSTIDWKAGVNAYSGTYSYLGNSDLISGLTSGSGQKTTYTYEAGRNLRNRIKNEFDTRTISQYDYTYDILGLRDSVTTGGEAFDSETHTPPARTSTYTANALNQYTEITTAPGPIAQNLPVYDDDGNLTEMSGPSGAVQYGYNGENRLVSVQPNSPVEGDKRVQFCYDYMGRRTQKTIYTLQAGAWVLDSDTRFLYDGWNLVQEWDNAGTNQKSYLWGLDLSGTVQGAGGVGGLLAGILGQASGVKLYSYDANGNVGQVVDSADGSVAAHYEYDPFGNAVYSNGPSSVGNPFRFSTKHFDDLTGLYYYGFRYYSKELGRWITKDPINELGSMILRNQSEKQFADLNLYGFVNNNPIDFFDVHGLKTTYQIQNLGGGAIISGTIGSAHAKTECLKGKYFEAKYIVIGMGFTAGVNIFGKTEGLFRVFDKVFKNYNSSIRGTQFTTNDNYPPSYLSYLDIEGHRLSFYYSAVLGDIEIGTYAGGRQDVRHSDIGVTGEFGAQIFKFEGVHLIRIGKPIEKCCRK